jgi:hypothetical protein
MSNHCSLRIGQLEKSQDIDGQFITCYDTCLAGFYMSISLVMANYNDVSWANARLAEAHKFEETCDG